MIVLNVVYNVKPGKREEFYQKILEKAQYFRGEKGCIQYKYYNSIDDPDELLLVEKWETEEDLTAHSKSEVFASLGPIKEEYTNDVKIEKF